MHASITHAFWIGATAKLIVHCDLNDSDLERGRGPRSGSILILSGWVVIWAVRSGIVSARSVCPASAIAEEAIKRIVFLYAVEKGASQPTDTRVALQRENAKPIFHDLEA